MHRLVGLLCALLLAMALATPGRAHAQAAMTPLERLLSAETERISAQVTVYVKNLRTGEEAGIRADDVVNSASTRKIGIMIMALQMADAGKLDLNRRVTITRADLQTGSGILIYHDLGGSVTLRDLITEMIITSDNTATLLIVNALGGVQVVNDWYEANGYHNTRVTAGTLDVSRWLYSTLGPEYESLSNEEIVGLQWLRTGNPLYAQYAELFQGARKPLADRVLTERQVLAQRAAGEGPTDRRIWTGATSAREMGRLLEAIEAGRSASQSSTEFMRQTLLRQQLGGSRIPQYLQQYGVAHKTGDGAAVANDVGIVYTPAGPIVMAFLVSGITGSYGAAEEQVGIMARLVVDYFN